MLYFSSFSARFTHFLYLGKMFAQVVKKLHWQKVVQVTLELTLWILSRNRLLIPREAIALAFLVHLPTPWRGINICREEYHYWRQVLQPLLPTIITHWPWMCHPIFFTFEAFAKLVHMLSSSIALRAALESNIASRYLLFHSKTCISVFQYSWLS